MTEEMKEGRWTKLNQGSLQPSEQTCPKKIEESEYPNNNRGKRIPERNSIKGNTLNKLREGDAQQTTKEGGCLEHT